MADQEIVITGGENAQPIAQWDPNSGAALPAYLSGALDELGTNIPDRNTVPSLSYEGKMWAIVKDGNRTKLQVQNADGDMVPVPIMRAVILNFNADRGRAYYPGTYNPAASAAPTCWSADGKAPDASVKEKQAALCNGCPQSVKGSKVMEGREMVACSSHRMIAVAPAFDLGSDPLRLKIAVTSDYDKEIVEHGWFAFRQYVDWLKSRGVAHTALVVTKMKFDPNPAYPKVLFALDRVLTQAEVAEVKEALMNPKVAELLAEKWTAAGTAGTPTNDSDIAPQPDLQQTDVRPAPQSPAHYHAKGTDGELWWDETASAWVKPWVVASPAPPQPTVPVETPAPVAPAAAPPEAAPSGPTKPSDPAHIAHAGTEHEMWWIDNAWVPVSQLQAGNSAAPVVEDGPPAGTATAPTADPSPPAATTPAPSGLSAALADGWAPHPSAPGYHWKGVDVKLDAEVAAMYPGNVPAAPATPSAPAGSPSAATEAAPATSTSGTTATTAASPSDGAIPPEVQGLLDKWTG
jgi:hypothetical protein